MECCAKYDASAVPRPRRHRGFELRPTRRQGVPVGVRLCRARGALRLNVAYSVAGMDAALNLRLAYKGEAPAKETQRGTAPAWRGVHGERRPAWAILSKQRSGLNCTGIMSPSSADIPVVKVAARRRLAIGCPTHANEPSSGLGRVRARGERHDPRAATLPVRLRWPLTVNVMRCNRNSRPWMSAADDALDVPPSTSDAQWRNIALTMKWARLDLNQRPRDYESPALTTELRARRCGERGRCAATSALH